MQNLKIRVNSKAESKEVMSLLDAAGYTKGIIDNISKPCWIAVLDGKEYSDYMLSKSTWYTANPKETTLPELRAMVNHDQDEPFLTPECTLNDQHAEIDQVRQVEIQGAVKAKPDFNFGAAQANGGVDATLAERQSTYGNFEDVAFVTENIMSILAQVRVNGLNDLPNTHRMALYMIASKMARIVNGDFNHLDSWHDIGGYSKLIEKLIKGE